MGWVISVPCWGDAYIERFVDFALPSHRLALATLDVPARYVVHTDQPERIRALFAGFSGDVDIRPVPRGDWRYGSFAAAHRDAIASADHGDRVALLCADMVLSPEVFAACERKFAGPWRAVVACATRTLPRTPLPFGARSRALLAWTMENAHPMVRACFWGERCQTPWAVYFRQDDQVTLRGFHLHPIAVVKDRDLPFQGTLDIDLLDNFGLHEIHVVTHPDELALAEVSPPDRPFRLAHTPMTPQSIALWTVGRTSAVHWWLSTHRIVITGEGRTPDNEIWQHVLDQPQNPLREAA